MARLTRFGLTAARAAGSARPNTSLFLATILVVAAALGLSWTTPSEGQGGDGTDPGWTCPQTGGSGWCWLAGAENPCPVSSSCNNDSGDGYMCSIGNNQYMEGTWKFAPASQWSSCSPGAPTTKSCTPTTSMCGTTYHYQTGFPCMYAYRCTGTWWWAACWGAGNGC